MTRAVNETITGLRGLLAISVVIYHIYSSSIQEQYIQSPPQHSLLSYLNYAGAVSVYLFFVISGYIIIQSVRTKASFGEFILNRILRIYPVFLFIHLLVFTIGPIIQYEGMHHISFAQYTTYFVSNLLLLPGIFPLPLAQLVAWSLSYEFAFYLLTGLFYFTYKKHEGSRSRRHILLALLLLISLSILFYRPEAIFFLVGVCLYLLEHQIQKRHQPRRLFNSAGILLLILIYIAMHVSPSLFIPVLLSFPFFYTIVVQEGWLARLLCTKPLTYLGTISYSLYMWHTFIMFPIKLLLSESKQILFFNSSFIMLTYSILSIILSIIVAHLSYKHIEGHLTKRLKHYLTKHKNLVFKIKRPKMLRQ